MTLNKPVDYTNHLIGLLEAIDINRLKHVSYKKYITRLVETSKRCLEADGASFNIIIHYLKASDGPCFQRDVIIDIISKVISEYLLEMLKKPFSRASSAQWNELACSIATLPDLMANFKAITKHPQFKKEPYYNRLTELIYESMEYHQETAEFNEYRLFLLKLIGRVAITDCNSIVWEKFTLRAINEPRENVQQYCFGILRSVIRPPAELTSLDVFIDHLILPIFSNLKPNKDTGQVIKLILETSVYESDHLRYLLCDKCIFKTNHHLAREKQAIILFNVAAYLSSLVTMKCDPDMDEKEDGLERESLLMETFLEIVKSWTNPTKILIRTYQHSKYISCALLIFLKHILDHDKRRLAYHANKIQVMIANSIPIYLNRASSEQRNLASCLCELILPKLRDIILGKQATKAVADGDFKLDFKVDLDDDLLYLQRLFKEDVDTLFQDVPDMKPTEANNATSTPNATGHNRRVSIIANANHPVANNYQSTHHRQVVDGQLQKETDAAIVDEANDKTQAVYCSQPDGKPSSSVLANQKCEASRVHQVNHCEDDDLLPYHISDDDDDDDEEEDHLGNDEFRVGDDAACVPIYLRDCIDGLIENNNHRYVRLCLTKAFGLLTEIVEQQDGDSDGHTNESVCLAGRPEKKPSLSQPGTNVATVNDTIKDVGVEFARTLLFAENQFNLEKFDEYRMRCLVTLCYLAPGLIGRYLLDELNGHNRSLGQQLDILHVVNLVSHRLAFGTSFEQSKIEFDASHQHHKPERRSVVTSGLIRPSKTKNGINRFAPYASLFFYGISHRLKADLLGVKSLVTSQPLSVMASFRRSQMENDNDLMTKHKIDAKIKTPEIVVMRAGAAAAKQVSLVEELDDDDHVDVGESVNATDTATKLLERNSISDDSYLLSRILLSISNILSCSAQQPVACKLSSDLLDILSAYRCHPDSGVQRAIASCLKMIRDCTPSTYYSEYIEEQMLRSFGPWLTKNESNILG